MKDVPIEEWLRTLSDRTPTPGGGAVAALAAATSAALIGMVTSYTQGGKWSDREDRMRELQAEATGWRAAALQLAEADERAFSAVGEAYALPKSNDDEQSTRSAAIQVALAGAAEPPVLTAQLAGRLVGAADELVSAGNPNVLSDVGVAAALAEAALTSAIMNIAINASLLTDPDVKSRLTAELASAEDGVERARAVVRRVRDGIAP
jgi:formiminotetrahydrofolate cyclodeaminase